jgi:hypothetical protein
MPVVSLRIAIIILCMAFVAVAGINMFYVFPRLNEQTRHNARDIQQIQQLLVTEKVCSLSNQGDACRALFDRLAVNLSEAQRFRLACDVLAPLDIPDAVRWAREAECPPPIASP